jgi:hypothetical protein
VDKVDWKELNHKPVYAEGKRYVGIFEWGFLYKEQALAPTDPHLAGKRISEPYWYVPPLLPSLSFFFFR